VTEQSEVGCPATSDGARMKGSKQISAARGVDYHPIGEMAYEFKDSRG
jgi:hypothetical protein